MLTEDEIIDGTIMFLQAESKAKDKAYTYCPSAGRDCNGYDDCMFNRPTSAPCLLFRDTYNKMAKWIEEARRKEIENNGRETR